MAARMTLNQDELSGVCASHAQFEARIDDKFDDLKETMSEAVIELKAVNKSLSDGRVEFKAHEGRLAALEKSSEACSADRRGMRSDINFLTRGYWMALGALALLQFILKFWH